MKDARTRWWRKAALAAGILVISGAGIALFAFRAPADDRTIVVETETLPTLLPHAHAISDSVDDPNHGVEIASLPVEITEPIWVTEMDFAIHNAPRTVLHHAQLHTTGDASKSGNAQLIAILGQESPDVIRFPAPAGIYLPAGTKLILRVMFHNPVPPLGEGGVYKDVSASITIKGVNAGEGRFMPAYLVLLELTDGSGILDAATFHVPVQDAPYVRTSAMNPPGDAFATFVAPQDGWILSAGGHQHAWQGGTELAMYLNGAKVRSYHSHLLDPNVPWSWKTDVDWPYLRVRKGDEISISSTYRNATDEELTGAMGMLSMMYVPDQFSLDRSYVSGWQVREALEAVRYAAYSALFPNPMR